MKESKKEKAEREKLSASKKVLRAIGDDKETLRAFRYVEIALFLDGFAVGVFLFVIVAVLSGWGYAS